MKQDKPYFGSDTHTRDPYLKLRKNSNARVRPHRIFRIKTTGCYRGFTLIELAMVILIIGLLLGGLLVPLATGIEQRHREQTRTQLAEIREALIGHALINGRLPCPDCPDNVTGDCGTGGTLNDGIEDRLGATPVRTCRTPVGNLPWVDLRVNGDDMWGNRFTYRISTDFAGESNVSPCGSATAGVVFELCTAGDIDIYADHRVGYVSPDVADNVVAVIVSHGKNRYEAEQDDQEVENYDRSPRHPVSGFTTLTTYNAGIYADKVFIDRDYSETDGVISYDDILIWISPALLMNRMVAAGRLP